LGHHLLTGARARGQPQFHVRPRHRHTGAGDGAVRRRPVGAGGGAQCQLAKKGESMTLNNVSTPPVLLVDDEPQLLHSVSVVLRSAGMTQILTQSDSREVLPMLAAHEVGVLVLDLTMPHLPGSVLLERIAADHPDVPVLVMTATNDLETAVQC